jgi:hypothetical protein
MRRARVGFVVLFLLVQLVLIASAGQRAEGSFGFRMFPESSWMRLRLYRRTAAGTFPVASDGRYVAHDGAGLATMRSVTERIRREDLMPRDQWMFASYGADAALFRVQAALNDLAQHQGSTDHETLGWAAEVEIRRNGADPVLHRLASSEARAP